MLKIKPSTTLAEIAEIRGKLGVEKITLHYDFAMLQPVLVTVHTATIQTYGRGETEFEALDDAFARLTHRMARVIADEHAGVAARE